jgi:hypothetical protein
MWLVTLLTLPASPCLYLNISPLHKKTKKYSPVLWHDAMNKKVTCRATPYWPKKLRGRQKSSAALLAWVKFRDGGRLLPIAKHQSEREWDGIYVICVVYVWYMCSLLCLSWWCEETRMSNIILHRTWDGVKRSWSPIRVEPDFKLGFSVYIYILYYIHNMNIYDVFLISPKNHVWGCHAQKCPLPWNWDKNWRYK